MLVLTGFSDIVGKTVAFANIYNTFHSLVFTDKSILAYEVDDLEINIIEEDEILREMSYYDKFAKMLLAQEVITQEEFCAIYENKIKQESKQAIINEKANYGRMIELQKHFEGKDINSILSK